MTDQLHIQACFQSDELTSMMNKHHWNSFNEVDQASLGLSRNIIVHSHQTQQLLEKAQDVMAITLPKFQKIEKGNGQLILQSTCKIYCTLFGENQIIECRTLDSFSIVDNQLIHQTRELFDDNAMVKILPQIHETESLSKRRVA